MANNVTNEIDIMYIHRNAVNIEIDEINLSADIIGGHKGWKDKMHYDYGLWFKDKYRNIHLNQNSCSHCTYNG